MKKFAFVFILFCLLPTDSILAQQIKKIPYYVNHIQHGYQDMYNFMFCDGDLEFTNDGEQMFQIYAPKHHFFTTELFSNDPNNPIDPKKFLMDWLAEDNGVANPYSANVVIKKTFGNKEFYYTELNTTQDHPMRASLYIENDIIVLMSIAKYAYNFHSQVGVDDLVYTYSRKYTLEDPLLGFWTYIPAFYDVNRLDDGSIEATFVPDLDTVYEAKIHFSIEEASGFFPDELRKIHEDFVKSKGGNAKVYVNDYSKEIDISLIYPIDKKNNIYQIDQYKYTYYPERGVHFTTKYSNSFVMTFSPYDYKNYQKDLWNLHSIREFSPDSYYLLNFKSLVYPRPFEGK